MSSLPHLDWTDGTGPRRAVWLGGSAPPRRAGPADDGTTAAAALARVQRGEALVYAGDFHNAQQLLAAMGRRLDRRSTRNGPARGPASPQEGGALFRADRAQKRREHDLLGRLLVPLERDWRIALRRAPDVAAACAEAFGPAPSGAAVIPLRELLGVVGAHEWRRTGVEVPALGARVHPHHGVYAPIRGEYVDLVAAAAAEWPIAGKRALDVGTGTGVLAFVLARAGAAVVATDVEPRAVACARENAERLGLGARVEIVEADLFPAGAPPFDVVVANPPWLPAAASSPLERAVYDPGGRFLEALVAGLPTRLAPAGEAWLVLSDLAELLGLRPPGHVEALVDRAGLAVAARREARPVHRRARDRDDPLHAYRAREVTRLFRLVRPQ